MNEEIFLVSLLFSVVVIGVSIPVAFALEKRLKAKLPHTRPYKWGFYVGAMCLACVPCGLVVFAAVPFAKDSEGILSCLAMGGWFILHGVCGFFIIKRKRWAWIVHTVLSCNLFGWIINSIYMSNRWREFVEEAGRFPATAIPSSGATTPAIPPSLPTGAPADGMFFLAIRGQRQGPYTVGQLRTMWGSGQVPADAQYWQQGMTTWYPLIELLERKP